MYTSFLGISMQCLPETMSFFCSHDHIFRTSGMAEDVITLLDYVEWKRNRDLHIIGISMGGMITLGTSFLFLCPFLQPFLIRTARIEMATRIPERIASLSLIVTTAGGRVWSNLPTVCSWLGLCHSCAPRSFNNIVERHIEPGKVSGYLFSYEIHVLNPISSGL